MSRKETALPALKIVPDHLQRTTVLMQDTARLAAAPPSSERTAEAVELVSSALERMTALQKSWAQNWVNWLAYAGTLGQTDTIPKYMERSGNIMLRAQAQLVSQMNDVSGLTDNVAVSYGYWLTKQMDND